MTEYSITLRPRLQEFKKINDYKYFDKILKKMKYYVIGKEKGNCEEISHYQMVLIYNKETRVDTVRRTLINNFKKYIPECDWKIALKVKSIKTNIEGVIGYCLKEGIDNISKLEKEEEYYLNLYMKNKVSKDYFRVNSKNYHIYVERYIQINEDFVYQLYKSTCHYKQEAMRYGLLTNKKIKVYYTDELIKYIIDNMIIEKYYFTFLTERNIDRVIGYLRFYLNGETGFCNFLEDLKSIN